MLIRQALVESVADEEPPAQVWNRIRACLSESKCRPAVRWTGPVLQAALVLLLLLAGSVSLLPEWTVNQLPEVLSTASPTEPSAALMDDVPTTSSVQPDAGELKRLRQYSSLQTQRMILQELAQPAPGVVVPADDIPPHPNSPQARATRLESSGEVRSSRFSGNSSGTVWQ